MFSLSRKQEPQADPELVAFLESLPRSDACDQAGEMLELIEAQERRGWALLTVCSLAILAVTVVVGGAFAAAQLKAVSSLKSVQQPVEQEVMEISEAEYQFVDSLSRITEEGWVAFENSQIIQVPLGGKFLVRYIGDEGYSEIVTIPGFTSVISPNGKLRVSIKSNLSIGDMEAIEDTLKTINASNIFTAVGETYVVSSASVCIDIIYHNWQGNYTGLKQELRRIDKHNIFDSIQIFQE